jgi:hypothetical protein
MNSTIYRHVCAQGKLAYPWDELGSVLASDDELKTILTPERQFRRSFRVDFAFCAENLACGPHPRVVG